MPQQTPEDHRGTCENYVPSDHWHIRKDVPLALLSVVATLILALGGWVWFLAGQASEAVETTRRVTELEKHDTARGAELTGISDRLARMEPMLALLVARMRDK